MSSSAHLRKKILTALSEHQSAGDRLEEEIGDLRHELRRVRDNIERKCGLPHVLEQKAKQLLDNINLCERDLNKNQTQQEIASKQLNSLQNYENYDDQENLNDYLC